MLVTVVYGRPDRTDAPGLGATYVLGVFADPQDADDAVRFADGGQWFTVQREIVEAE